MITTCNNYEQNWICCSKGAIYSNNGSWTNNNFLIQDPFQMFLAVIGWSQVTCYRRHRYLIIWSFDSIKVCYNQAIHLESRWNNTLIPALRHLPTASGTAARGGSIMEMRPTNTGSQWGSSLLQHQMQNPQETGHQERKWQKPLRKNTSISVHIHSFNWKWIWKRWDSQDGFTTSTLSPDLRVLHMHFGKHLSIHHPKAALFLESKSWSIDPGFSQGLPSSPAGA